MGIAHIIDKIKEKSKSRYAQNLQSAYSLAVLTSLTCAVFVFVA